MKTCFLTKGKYKLALSLATLMATGFCSVNASDSLAEALKASTMSGTLFSYYDMDSTEYFPPASATNRIRQDIGGIGAELRFLTGSFNGFRVGLTAQGLANFAPSEAAKDYFGYDWNSEGTALSEAYLAYEHNYIDLKVGRQYYNSKYTGLVPPLVATNTDVGYKEAFEGVSTRIKLNSIDTVIGLADFWKFAGRSSAVTGAASDDGAPEFKDKVIIGGFGPFAYKFDNIFNSFVTYTGIPSVSLTAAYANVSGLEYEATKGDINFYFAAAGYKTPALFENAVVGINAMYKGSRTNGTLQENYDFDGNYYTGMVGLFNAYGFDFIYAYSTVSKNQMALQGIGNDCGAFTATPIYGPFLFMSFAGMELNKLSVGYDLSNVGIKGLRVDADYYYGEQHNGSNVNAGNVLHGQKPGTRIDVEGWDTQVTYKVPTVKGLKLSAIYETLDRKLKYTSGGSDGKTTDEELWLRVSYDFDILK